MSKRKTDMLARCGVDFDEESHTYTLDGRRLSGITRIIQEKLFPDMHDGIPISVLNKAAERGSELHAEIEMLINDGVPTYSEGGKAFEEHFHYDLMNKRLVSEYRVTDFDKVASNIDIVRVTDDGTVDLFDIKTTSVLNTEYVMWQLSIYAYLFELINPTMKVTNIRALHIRDGELNEVEVRRIESEHCRKLIQSYFTGEPFSNPLYPTVESEELARIERVESSIIEMEKLIKAAKERRETMLSRIKESMRDNGIRKWETERMTITYVEPSSRLSVDIDSLRENHPQLLESYLKESPIKDSIRIRLKN